MSDWYKISDTQPPELHEISPNGTEPLDRDAVIEALILTTAAAFNEIDRKNDHVCCLVMKELAESGNIDVKTAVLNELAIQREMWDVTAGLDKFEIRETALFNMLPVGIVEFKINEKAAHGMDAMVKPISNFGAEPFAVNVEELDKAVGIETPSGFLILMQDDFPVLCAEMTEEQLFSYVAMQCEKGYNLETVAEILHDIAAEIMRTEKH